MVKYSGSVIISGLHNPRGKQFKSTEHKGVGWVSPETFLTNFVKTCAEVNDMGSDWSVGFY